MRIICMYLPQYHQIPENDNWWGKGYTEWSAVKNAKPLYKSHKQPRIPLDKKYYDLSDETGKVWEWQAQLTKKYNIYGFCIYHYWFGGGKKLLEKPVEILFNHSEIDVRYCFCWANESWTRTWYGLEKEVLMKQEYGDVKEWDKHYTYLLPFFKDKRYIKINNCPVLNIYRSYDIDCLKDMLDRWRYLAKRDGFNGLYIVSANTANGIEKREELVDAFYNFEPGYSIGNRIELSDKIGFKTRKRIMQLSNRLLGTRFLEGKINVEAIYKVNTNRNNTSKKTYLGSFYGWDNTPRRSYKGTVYYGSTPEKFKENLLEIKTKTQEEDFVYINAWNEWGEGAYLEPDENYGYTVLEAINEVMI